VASSEVSPLALLAELVAVYTVWQAFPDGPLAFYVTVGVWVVWRMVVTAREHDRDWWPVCLFGALLGLMQAGCGLAYVADGRSFVCDGGTGLPITPLVLAGAAGLAAHYVRKKHATKSRP
jgi:hypothetical protein